MKHLFYTQLSCDHSLSHNLLITKRIRYSTAGIAVVKSAFGILYWLKPEKFRVYYQKPQVNTDHIDIIVLATTCLHNFVRGKDVNLRQPGDLEHNEEFHGLQPLEGQGEIQLLKHLKSGMGSRNTSTQVSWQDDDKQRWEGQVKTYKKCTKNVSI